MNEPTNKRAPRERRQSEVYNPDMRLSAEQCEAIKTAAVDVFGADAQVWLFGSRADDSRRGGDIDLYIETGALDARAQARLESRLWARLQRVLGERKIDIITRARGASLRPIDQQARNTGIRL
jgi:predicted nucleotidyltransferase